MIIFIFPSFKDDHFSVIREEIFFFQKVTFSYRNQSISIVENYCSIQFYFNYTNSLNVLLIWFGVISSVNFIFTFISSYLHIDAVHFGCWLVLKLKMFLCRFTIYGCFFSLIKSPNYQYYFFSDNFCKLSL